MHDLLLIQALQSIRLSEFVWLCLLVLAFFRLLTNDVWYLCQRLANVATCVVLCVLVREFTLCTVNVCPCICDWSNLFFISRSTLGTPTDETWPGVSCYPDFKTTFPKWSPTPLSRVVKGLDPQGLDLLSVRI